MTWEEIIIQIRKDEKYKELVEKAYFEENLPLNIERFRTSDEYAETLQHIRSHYKNITGLKLMDLGAGNGVASLSFARDGFSVTAVEPDKSETIGSGAIRKLEKHFNTGRVSVVESFAENIPFSENTFDVVYVRQAMHHAHNLQVFVKQAVRVLKPGGVLFTVRDHEIYDEKDKEWFLQSHPLHKFYGGENAFMFEEYRGALTNAGVRVLNYWKHYDSVINYFPETKEFVREKIQARQNFVNGLINKKFPAFLRKNNWLINQYTARVERKLGKVLDEKTIPGRLVSFFCVK